MSYFWELKTDPVVFEDVWQGRKTYEIRFDDRGYTDQDRLRLLETSYTGAEMKSGLPLIFTGREMVAEVTHILRGPIYGLLDGWVIMSIRVVGRRAK